MWRRGILAMACAFAVSATPAGAAEPANGQLVATFSGDSLVSMNPDGTGRRTLWKVPGELERVTAPAWSPDGNAIAFEYWDPAHGGRIAVYDLRTGTQRTITDHPGPVGNVHTQDRDAGWSADGRVLFRRSHYGTDAQSHTLWAVQPDGSGLEQLAASAGFGWPISWWSEGWYYYRDGSDAARIASIDGEYDLQLPFGGLPDPVSWSPDGAWLTFGEDDGLTAVSFDGDAYGLTVTDARTSDGEPSWSPAGDAIVYKRVVRGPVGIAEQLRILDLETGTSRKVIDGNYFTPVWQPCVAGVTVRCSSEPPPCLEPGSPPGWDPQPACLTERPLPRIEVPAPRAPIAPPQPATVFPSSVSATAKLNRKTRRVALSVHCWQRCTLSVQLRVRLNTGRVLKTRKVVRSGRAIDVQIKLPKLPPKRRIMSIRAVGTTKTASAKARALTLTVKR